MRPLFKYGFAAFIRYMFINSRYMQFISDRIEVSTPLNSWKRILEGTYLYEQGVDPYDGDMFHESPILLYCCSFLLRNIPEIIPFIFISLDLLTAFILTKMSEFFVIEMREKQEKNRKTYSQDFVSHLISESQFKTIPIYVTSAYLFNPYTILSCVGYSTTVVANVFLALTYYGMVSGSRFLSCISLAAASVHQLYPAMLLIPVSMYINEKSSIRCGKCSLVRTLALYCACVFGLLYLSNIIAGSWKFLGSTYGFILTVPDLRPNIGLFWYFFTEMFEHFRSLFICAFQINATFLYLIPLSLRLRDEPMLLATSLTSLIAIFKSYPSLGDVGFYLALLPMWKHLCNHMQQGFVVGCFFMVTSILGPTVWHLWIYSKSANANFFFGVTLAFATAQIFLVTDLMFAYIKREYSLQNGLSRKLEGKPAKLALE